MPKKEIQQSINACKKPSQRHATVMADIGISKEQRRALLQNLRAFIPNTNITAELDNLIDQQLVTVEPISKAIFPQNIWLTFNANQSTINKNGMCAALLITWYQKLMQGQNLIDILVQDPKSCISELDKLHTECNKQVFDFEISQKRMPGANLDEILSKSLESRKKHLNAQQAHTMRLSPHYSQEFFIKEYFRNLEANHQECVGLHSIQYISKDIEKDSYNEVGHIIGWTAIADGYLLFDADEGELLFENYHDLSTYIYEYYFKKNDQYIVMEDFYSEEDIKAVAQINAHVNTSSKAPVINSAAGSASTAYPHPQQSRTEINRDRAASAAISFCTFL
ncbi:MAG: hypothetical protein ABSF18_00880 [Gammaproteobacteria bacterium]